ncbi:alpha/beta hydrolase [Aeromonas salmonicida]|uniref:alpha/beta hydrolase n=1 Tax=Aeromonas salmonicida TaxID=645 RepID=UPI0038BB4DE3
MLARTRRLLRRSLLTLLLALLAAWGVIAYFAWQAAPLQLWHTFIPPELSADELDSSDWPAYQAREQQLFDLVEQEVVAKTPPEQQLAGNRYYQGSPINPAHFQDDWNRSYLLRPEGEVKGVAVFLHGLTDSPYSLRHLAQRYRERGFIALGLRIPGHGTVPAGLVNMEWETWLAATRLAVREARAQAPSPLPLHLVGFSNGGALAVKYALDALEDKTGTVARPDRLVLISPMIGVTRFARFAGLKAVPALLPAFANAAWLGIMPEFNPFKYNSFPVNGARQSYRLTHAIQQQVRQLATSGELAAFPPALTFQSVMDYTVSTRSIIADLYHFLPNNGSELVLFDINRGSVFGPLLNSASELALSHLLPSQPQPYALTVVGNEATSSPQTQAKTMVAGSTLEQVRPLGIDYPKEIYSLSHVALPFPMDDPLYGMAPHPEQMNQYGINLGGLALRGERGVLIVNPGSLTRTSSNPFYPYLQERVMETLAAPLHPPSPLASPQAKPASDNHTDAAYEAEIETFLQETDTPDLPF